jgi:hypothetical protein
MASVAGSASMEFKGVKLMAKQIDTLPEGLIGVIWGLANPRLRGVGQ